jgi:CDP-diacylglycerol--glycerol-3-phosphate 3-phosphatidyltransferase
MSDPRRVLTFPNLLSVLRLFLLVPVFYFLVRQQRGMAFLFMVLGASTDMLDGYIARKFDQCSDLGRLMDPVIDKISVLSVILYMVISADYYFPIWYFILLMAREALFLLAGFLILIRPGVVVESRRPGKNAALANALTVIFYLFELHPWAEIILAAALVITVYSTWRYFQLYWPQIRRIFKPGS